MPSNSKQVDQVRVDIGFSGGQVLAVKATAAQLQALRKALNDGSGWHDLQSEDATVALDLGQICFLKVESDSGRVGF